MQGETQEQKLGKLELRLGEEPENGLLWLEYGDLLEEQDAAPHRIVTAYQQAQVLLPHRDLRPRLGSAYEAAGEFERGVSLILESLNENPRVTAYCYLADIYLKKDMCQEAMAACQRAIGLEPRYEEAHYLLGESVKKQSVLEAVGHYRKAIELDPQYHLAWQALGRELVRLHDTRQEGIRALCKAVEIDPEDGWSRLFLAYAYWEAGELPKAEEQYRSAIRVFPGFSKAYVWFAEFLARQGRGSEALEMREHARTCAG